jgi:hypothetical protein
MNDSTNMKLGHAAALALDCATDGYFVKSIGWGQAVPAAL